MAGKRLSSAVDDGVKHKSPKSKKARLSQAVMGETSAAASGSKVTLRVEDTDPNWTIGAALISSVDFETPDIPYTLCVAPARPASRLPNSHGPRNADNATDGSSQARLADRTILYGQSGPMYYTSTNWDTGGTEAVGDRIVHNSRRTYAGEYLVGVRDPSSSTLTLRALPLYTISRRVISLADRSGLDSSSTLGADWQKRVQARRDLGEEFGNRKTKTKARNDDRMKVAVAEGERDVENTMNLVAQGIVNATMGMEDEEAVRASADAKRPIPPVDLTATHPSEAYRIDVLITPTVQTLLRSAVRYFYAPPLPDAEIKASLPAGASQPEYLVTRLLSAAKQSRPGGVAASSEDARTRLVLAYYSLLLWAFKRIAGGREVGDRQVALEKLGLKDVPGGEQVLEDLMTRFTEGLRGSNKSKMTPWMEQKLMSYLLAITLHLDGFTIDHGSLAADLNMSPPKIAEYLRSLGCTSSTSTPRPSAVGVSPKKGRVMVLACPVVLPQPRRGMTKR